MIYGSQGLKKACLTDDLFDTPRPSVKDAYLKRVLDVFLASMMLVLVLPLLLLLAAAIKVESPGPAFFLQTRYGHRRAPFKIIKLRTMTWKPGGEFAQATKSDNRVTRIGKVLRRASLDEIPQLINVMQGHMSLVGPRPHPIELDDYYSERIEGYRLRYLVRPGLTGLAQVNGARGETPTLQHMQRRISYDTQYVLTASLVLDLSILLQSVRAVMLAENAH